MSEVHAEYCQDNIVCNFDSVTRLMLSTVHDCMF